MSAKFSASTTVVTACTAIATLSVLTLTFCPLANADNKRLNQSVVANIYTAQHNVGCTNRVTVNPQLQMAAQRHADDVLNNRSLSADLGSDGSTVETRAKAEGYSGGVAETVGINPALAISGIELMNQWFSNPEYAAIMQNCAYTEVGVWSENSLDRTVVIAVYGIPN